MWNSRLTALAQRVLRGTDRPRRWRIAIAGVALGSALAGCAGTPPSAPDTSQPTAVATTATPTTNEPSAEETEPGTTDEQEAEQTLVELATKVLQGMARGNVDASLFSEEAVQETVEAAYPDMAEILDEKAAFPRAANKLLEGHRTDVLRLIATASITVAAIEYHTEETAAAEDAIAGEFRSATLLVTADGSAITEDSARGFSLELHVSAHIAEKPDGETEIDLVVDTSVHKFVEELKELSEARPDKSPQPVTSDKPDITTSQLSAAEKAQITKTVHGYFEAITKYDPYAVADLLSAGVARKLGSPKERGEDNRFVQVTDFAREVRTKVRETYRPDIPDPEGAAKALSTTTVVFGPQRADGRVSVSVGGVRMELAKTGAFEADYQDNDIVRDKSGLAVGTESGEKTWRIDTEPRDISNRVKRIHETSGIRASSFSNVPGVSDLAHKWLPASPDQLAVKTATEQGHPVGARARTRIV